MAVRRRECHPPVHASGVKLPKIDVPKFNGTILSWRNFWKQFKILLHSRTQILDMEKLAYLRHVLKDSPTRHTIEGLSGTGDNYVEAIECLRKRYNRPHLLHEMHVHAIIGAPTLKYGSGRELRHLYDLEDQHCVP